MNITKLLKQDFWDYNKINKRWTLLKYIETKDENVINFFNLLLFEILLNLREWVKLISRFMNELNHVYKIIQLSIKYNCKTFWCGQVVQKTNSYLKKCSTLSSKYLTSWVSYRYANDCKFHQLKTRIGDHGRNK